MKGVTSPSQGTAIGAKAGGVGRHSPGAGAADENFRDRRPTPVIGPQGDDASRSQLADGDPRVIFRQAMAGQVGVVSRVQRPGLRRETIDEHIVRSLGDSRRR